MLMESVQATPPNCRILNNSPALHSLKRQQLVQLCKRNGIKASGKNVELIGKLRAHASDVSDNCMSPGDEDKENKRMPLSRPSETWSVIDENSRDIKTVRLELKNIQEEVEQEMLTQSTLRGFGGSSLDEYHSGSTNSKKDSTMKSPFKVLANSLKRVGNKPSPGPAQAQVSYQPMSIDDPVVMQQVPELTTPIKTRPSPLPSPATGDESDAHDVSIRDLGQSTIRLVSAEERVPSPPALCSFTPTFDACYSPESHVFPSRQPMALELEEPLLPGAFPGMVEKSPNLATAASPPPFVFGSPAHQTTNMQFHSAAASVLAEMNARLGLAGTPDEVGIDILAKKNVQPSIFGSLLNQNDKPKADITMKFDKAHEQQFQQMEGISDWYARKYGKGLGAGTSVARQDMPDKKRKSDVLTGPSKRIVRPSVTNNRRGSRSQALRVVSQSQLVDEQSEERRAKRAKISFVDDPAAVEGRETGKDTKSNSMQGVEDQQTEEEREKERNAIKKRLEVSRARRRSSMGRVSVGANKSALIPNQPKKGITSKFGFLSSAKNLVKNVWNRGIGAGPQKQEVKPKAGVRIPTGTSGSQKKEGLGVKLGPKAETAPKQTAPVASLANKGSLPAKRPSVRISTNDTSRSRASTVTSTSHTGSQRAAIPSFTRVVSGVVSVGRTSSLVRKEGSSTNAHDIRRNQGGTVNSIGFKSSEDIPTGSTRTSEVSNANSAARKRASTLLAPTASSLAKMQQTVKPSSLSTKASTIMASSITRATASADPALTPSHAVTSPRQVDNKTGSGAIEKPEPGRIFASGPPVFAPSPSKLAAIKDIQAATAKSRPLPGRRPRISRSRVIARVGAQRIASRSKEAVSVNDRRSLNTTKTRGSLGVRVSGIGGKTQTRESFANYRKRMRQSEILRRRSKMSSVGGGAFGKTAAQAGEASSDGMDED